MNRNRYALEQDPIICRHAGEQVVQQAPRPTPCPYTVLAPQYFPAPPPPPPPAPPSAPVIATPAPTPRDPDVMEVDRHRARTLSLCYRCRKPGHITRDCQEKNFKDIIRGLTVADLEEIAAMVAGGSQILKGDDEEDEDFSAPQ